MRGTLFVTAQSLHVGEVIGGLRLPAAQALRGGQHGGVDGEQQPPLLCH